MDLLNESAIVTAYDPIAIPNAKKVFGNQITYTDDIRDALMDSELAIIATEWDQIKSFPLHLYELYMKEAIIIDGRNCLPLHEMKTIPFIIFPSEDLPTYLHFEISNV